MFLHILLLLISPFAVVPLLPPPPFHVVGIAGGICSGKSSISSHLVSKYNSSTLSIVPINSDRLASYPPGSPLFDSVVAAFPTVLTTSGPQKGTVNRTALGEIVFNSPPLLSRLESMVWPTVTESVQATLTSLKSPPAPPPPPTIVLLESASLVKASWDTTFCDTVWAITTPPGVAVPRIMERDQCDEMKAWSKVKAQEVAKDGASGSTSSSGNVRPHVRIIENDKEMSDLMVAAEAALDAVVKTLHVTMPTIPRGGGTAGNGAGAAFLLKKPLLEEVAEGLAKTTSLRALMTWTRGHFLLIR